MAVPVRRADFSSPSPAAAGASAGRRLMRMQTVGNMGESIFDGEVVSSSLIEIANKVEATNPRRLYAFEKAHQLDPTSSGRGVRQFKTALLQRLERENDPTLKGRVHQSDAREMQRFYREYYKKHIQALQNAADEADHALLTKAYQTAPVLIEVLKAVNVSQSVEVDQAGKLPNGLEIAVKRHRTSSFQGAGEFRAEIEAIANLRHKNIITLLGFCAQGEEKILVYEYMDNKSLASIIADETKRKLLNWSKRLQIIRGIADGLAYLHDHSQMCIVHMDLKASNILLDHEMSAKISDFALAITLAPNVTTEVAACGTRGYADPEYVATGKISEKTDVHGFGIVLLEIICGKMCLSYTVKAESTSRGLPSSGCCNEEAI